MSAVGLGCVKTPTLAARVETSRRNCVLESQIILHTRGVMPPWRIVFSTFRDCMSFYTARVIRVGGHRSRLLAHVRIARAGSTGRCNTGVKSLCGGFESQGLTWPFVELTRYFVQMGLRVHRQVGSLRKILSQQAIGVLIGTALPRTLRIAEVNVDVGR